MVAGAAASTSRSSVGPLVQPQLCCLCKPRWHLVRCFFSSPEVWPAHGHPACWRLHTGVSGRAGSFWLADECLHIHRRVRPASPAFTESDFTRHQLNASVSLVALPPRVWGLQVTNGRWLLRTTGLFSLAPPAPVSLNKWIHNCTILDLPQTVCKSGMWKQTVHKLCSLLRLQQLHIQKGPLWPLFCPTEIWTHNPWSLRLGIQRQIIFAANGAHRNYCLLKCIVKNESKAFRCQSKFHLN